MLQLFSRHEERRSVESLFKCTAGYKLRLCWWLARSNLNERTLYYYCYTSRASILLSDLLAVQLLNVAILQGPFSQ